MKIFDDYRVNFIIIAILIGFFSMFLCLVEDFWGKWFTGSLGVWLLLHVGASFFKKS